MPARDVPFGDVDLTSTLGSLAFLPGDPTVRVGPGRFERATVTPDGAGSVSVTWHEGSRAWRPTATARGGCSTAPSGSSA